MTIEKKNIQDFWAAQAKKSKLRNESISNLEEDEDLLKKKVYLEQKKIIPFLKPYLTKNAKLLDLGSGTGQWAFRFAPEVYSVTLVEFSSDMMDIAKNLSNGKFNNLDFVLSEAQDYISDNFYDLIWISGLLIYLTDSELQKLVYNCRKMLQEGGVLVLRDGTGIGERYEINNKFSSALGHNYSATYRTSHEYISMFKNKGFNLIEHCDVFEENSPLNKWNETRLRLYKFG